MIRQCSDGEKHNTLLQAAKLCGGYVAAGRMEEDEVVRVLTREILKRDVDDEQQAVRTIKEAMEKVSKTLSEPPSMTSAAQRELLINDGDMSFISSDDEDFVGLMTTQTVTPVGRTLVILRWTSTSDTRRSSPSSMDTATGKTTMVLYLLGKRSYRHGWKWVVYSSENTRLP